MTDAPQHDRLVRLIEAETSPMFRRILRDSLSASAGSPLVAVHVVGRGAEAILTYRRLLQLGGIDVDELEREKRALAEGAPSA